MVAKIDWKKDFTAILIVDDIDQFLSSRKDYSHFYKVITCMSSVAMEGAFIIPCITSAVIWPDFLDQTHRHLVYLPIASLESPYILRK